MIDRPEYTEYIEYMGDVKIEKTMANRFATWLEALRRAKLNTIEDVSDERSQGYFQCLQEMEEYLEQFI